MVARLTAQLMAMSVAAVLTASAQSAEAAAARKEIETAYAKALEAMRNAKSLQDLDELNRSFDTQDWQTIVPGQPQPRHWEDLRKYGFEGLWKPFQSAEFIIDTFQRNGDTATLTGKLRQVGMDGNVALIPLKETWKKTVIGWKRQIHQKFPPGQTPK